MIKLRVNQQGGAIVLVLIVLLVLSVLGATFMAIALAETQQVSRQKKAMQAYYLARSGADATAEDIINNSNDKFRDSLERPPWTTIISTDNPLAQGTFNVSVVFQNNSIVINATGFVPDPPRSPVSATARLRLHDLQSRAITAVNDLDLTNLSTLQGDVESTSGTVTGRPRHFWHQPNNIYQNTRRSLPAVTPPSLPNYNSGAASPTPHSFVVPNNEIQSIPGSFTYQDIIVNNGGVLRFNTSGGDIQIVVRGVFDIKGGFEIIGNNRVHIILNTPAGATNVIKTSDNNNNNRSDQLFLFLTDRVNLQVKTGARDFSGHIYAPQGYVTLGSNAIVRGSVTGNIFSAFGNPSVFHEPLLFTPPGFPDLIAGESRYWRGNWE